MLQMVIQPAKLRSSANKGGGVHHRCAFYQQHGQHRQWKTICSPWNHRVESFQLKLLFSKRCQMPVRPGNNPLSLYAGWLVDVNGCPQQWITVPTWNYTYISPYYQAFYLTSVNHSNTILKIVVWYWIHMDRQWSIHFRSPKIGAMWCMIGDMVARPVDLQLVPERLRENHCLASCRLLGCQLMARGHALGRLGMGHGWDGRNWYVIFIYLYIYIYMHTACVRVCHYVYRCVYKQLR